MKPRWTGTGLAGTQKKQAVAIFAALGVAALGACSAGTGGNSASSAASNPKTVASTPTASEKDMLLVSEVPGATFDSSIDPALAESLTSPISEGMTVEPTECTKLVDVSAKLASVPTALAQISDQSLSASISLSKQSSLYDEITGASDGCGDVTVTADGNAVARNELEAQNLPPEAMDFLKDMDLKSTFSVHTRPWDPQLSSSPQKVTAEESYGEGTVAGVKTNVTSYRIIGIVNGVVIAVSTVPTPSADHIRKGEAGLTIENPEISQEAKDAAKARAIEIFDVQAQKVRAAK